MNQQDPQKSWRRLQLIFGVAAISTMAGICIATITVARATIHKSILRVQSTSKSTFPLPIVQTVDDAKPVARTAQKVVATNRIKSKTDQE